MALNSSNSLRLRMRILWLSLYQSSLNVDRNCGRFLNLWFPTYSRTTSWKASKKRDEHALHINNRLVPYKFVCSGGWWCYGEWC
ncbi:hypothetical protein I7I50_10440 [Histoplasma capsulatum G186AR]|uniref:Uncharacterized protein n=1 Tax=Ajellomyces capsulatus TaxID=5037 RepID=A0A8H7Z9H7_AJECA|nr:hypothetical protein I7I52_01679 [Histoplasma capsulatum]QSS69225.1 hypothetical protein I7I50_10440 [Histoplasma capsulatum G186AR]